MHHYIDLPFVKKTKISWILYQKKNDILLLDYTVQLHTVSSF